MIEDIFDSLASEYFTKCKLFNNSAKKSLSNEVEEIKTVVEDKNNIKINTGSQFKIAKENNIPVKEKKKKKTFCNVL